MIQPTDIRTPFENDSSPLVCTNDGRIRIEEPNPGDYVLYDMIEQHVTLYTRNRIAADAYIAGYDEARRLARSPNINRDDAQHFVMVETSLAALTRLTPEQRNSLFNLARSWHADRIRAFSDNYKTDNLLFTVFRGNRAELNGLIEPDGRVNT